MPITANEFLNLVAILNSIDEVPGMPVDETVPADERWQARAATQDRFRRDPLRFLRRADDATRDAIWASVMQRVRPAVLLAAAE